MVGRDGFEPSTIALKEPPVFHNTLLFINLYLDAHCKMPDFSSLCITNPGKNPAVIFHYTIYPEYPSAVG